MTPEEKAKELVAHYKHYVGDTIFGECKVCQAINVRHCAHPEECGNSIEVSLAKACAIICVEEILRTYEGTEEFVTNNGGEIRYWQQVKQSIQQLK